MLPAVAHRHWVDRYLGLSFKDGGRDFTGVDCWGLVRLVYGHECGVALPAYGEISARDLARIAGEVESAANADPWIAAAPARAFDVVVMMRRHRPVHVGVMVDAGRVLHIEAKTAAVCVPLDHASLVFRRRLFRRHRDML